MVGVHLNDDMQSSNYCDIDVFLSFLIDYTPTIFVWLFIAIIFIVTTWLSGINFSNCL